MQHYVIVGNGPAGIEAALAIRQRHRPDHARISVISDESDYFFSRTALMYAFMDKLDRRDLEPFERKMWEKQAIERVRGRVVDLDADAKLLTLRSGETIGYDKLLLATGARPRMIPWAGSEQARDGIVHFVSLQDLDDCERLTWSSEQAVVVGGGLIGVELVECLHHHKVDVTFLVREPHYWPMALGPEEGEMVSAHIRGHGIDLRHEEEISAIHVDDDGRVSEIATDRGDTLPCQMLGVCVGVVANHDFLREATTPPDIDRGILVDRAFRTSLPDVWAAGDCCEIDLGDDMSLIETIWYSAKLHGHLAGRSMIGDPIHYAPPLFYNSSKFFDIEYTTVGKVVGLPPGTGSLYRRHPTRPISQRIVAEADGRVCGFNMLGSRWNHVVLERWISQRRSLDYVRDHLHQAQFDVEFGRVDLDGFEEKEFSS